MNLKDSEKTADSKSKRLDLSDDDALIEFHKKIASEPFTLDKENLLDDLIKGKDIIKK